MPSCLGGKSRGAFGQLVFFLAGNRTTIVAFEKEVSLKSLSLFSKIKRLFDSTEPKLEKKRLISISSKEYWWKAKSSSYENCIQRTSSLCFIHGGELALF